ncbi:MAG: nuclear transport factor 2 family protein [Armatimonadota bacterium]
MLPRRRIGFAALTVIVVLLILAAAGAAAWYFLLRSTPDRTVARLLQAQRDGDEETFKSLLTEDSRGQASLLMTVTSRLIQAGDEPQYTLGDPEVDGESATVPVTFAAPRQMADATGVEEIRATYVLQRENGAWRVAAGRTLTQMSRDVMSLVREMMRGGQSQ